MLITKIIEMGMPVERWHFNNVEADFGVDEGEGKYATLYRIESKNEGKGYATELLKESKKYYEDKGLKFGGSVALNDRMSHIYKKLNIEEYD